MEVALAFITNLQGLFQVVGGACVVGVVLSCMAFVTSRGDKESKLALSYGKKFALGAILTGLISCVPSINDIWKVRIALVKYHLASQANISKSTETIERIAEKLECKYLGCEEKKK